MTLRLAIAAVCVLALCLRLTGIDRELPQWHEPDPFSVSQMQQLQRDPAASWDSGFEERYPQLLSRTLALIPRGDVPAKVKPGEDALAVHLATASQPFLRVRLAVAWLGTLLVPLTWLVARRFMRDSTALLSALFVALSLLHLFFSQQARPHAAHASADWLVVWLALLVAERGSWGFVFAAGVAAGLAIALLQTGVFVLPPLCLSLLLMPRRWSERLACVVLVPFGALCLASLYYVRLPYIDSEGLHLAGAGSHTIASENVTGTGLAQWVSLLRMHDPVIAILAACGAVLAAGRLATRRAHTSLHGRRALWIVAAYAVPYAAVISIDSEVYERFLLPLMPCVAFCAAAAVMWAGERAGSLMSAISRGARGARLAQGVVVALAILAAIAQPAYAALRFVLAARAPDTYEQCVEWLEHEPHARSARILVSPTFAVPVFWGEAGLRAHEEAERKTLMPWLIYQTLMPASERRPSFELYAFPLEIMTREDTDTTPVKRLFERLQPEYVVIEAGPRTNYWPMLRALHQMAVAYGDLVFESHGESPDVETLGPLEFQDVTDLAARIVKTRAFGPKILVYRIRH